ncbi:MAG TPA: 3-dehydroquinate synthase [Gemmatimonadales bacterium]|nr:3-dehydroquinate synthase [Gemmatimonadales bacterium]
MVSRSEPITVRHAAGAYPVHVEAGLLRRLPELLAQALPRRRLVLITDETVAARFDAWIQAGHAAEPRLEARLGFPAGEASKTRETWSRLSDAMLARALDRDTAVIALGGGVVGDLAGFVAATYLRGIPYAQVPTTLLAMVDASVGGKVGVDTPLGKNLIGAFHPPAVVVADPWTLTTLPDPVYRAGLAETVKHGLIADAAYFAWIEAHTGPLLARDPDALTRLVRRSVEIKAQVVTEDEREAGRRAVLNAGHTVAHALEQASDLTLPHGEAVSLGLVAETRIAERLGLAPAGLAERVAALLEALGLPVRRPGIPVARALEAMRRDKKNRAGQVRLALPAGLGVAHPGEGRWTVPVTDDLLARALDSLA